MLTSEKFRAPPLFGPGSGEGQGPEQLGREIIKKLHAIVLTIERDVLKDLADDRLADGRVTVMNQAARPRAAYEHFGDEAAAALAASEAPDTRGPRAGGRPVPGSFTPLQAQGTRLFERRDGDQRVLQLA